MGLQTQIPDSVARAIRLPDEEIAEELRVELAVALYDRGLLSFGKAREHPEKGKYDFGRLLGNWVTRQQFCFEQGPCSSPRELPSASRHYGYEELEDDLSYARGE